MKLKRGGMVCFRMIFGSKSPPVILFSTRNSHWYTLFPLKTTYSKGVSHCQISGGYTVYPLREADLLWIQNPQDVARFDIPVIFPVILLMLMIGKDRWWWCRDHPAAEANILSNFAWTFPVLLVCCKSIPPATPKVLTHNSGHRFWVGSHVPEAWHGVVS